MVSCPSVPARGRSEARSRGQGNSGSVFRRSDRLDLQLRPTLAQAYRSDAGCTIKQTGLRPQMRKRNRCSRRCVLPIRFVTIPRRSVQYVDRHHGVASVAVSPISLARQDNLAACRSLNGTGLPGDPEASRGDLRQHRNSQHRSSPEPFSAGSITVFRARRYAWDQPAAER